MAKMDVTFSATMPTNLALQVEVDVPDDLTTDELNVFLSKHQRTIDGGDYFEIDEGGWSNDGFEISE